MPQHERFADRRQAGRELARRVAALRLIDPVVLALPRGGVPVALEVARALRAPLDLVFVRKIGVPGQPELAVAAVVDGGDPDIVVNNDIAAAEQVSRSRIETLAKKELAEIERRRQIYMTGRRRVPLEGRTLVMVDDGIATGASMRAALTALRRKRPKCLIVAVPVASEDSVQEFRLLVDDVVCLQIPHPFFSVGDHYRDFHQVPDEEVVALLNEAETSLAQR